MPQITKVRIANFQYNNGSRIIADELYDFEQANGSPSDVLINLANGGGKSVLVQLMMQPVIPKAKVGSRRVEGFFTKSTDHCYIVLEWALDNSKMKLLTGIAMAASDASTDTEADRGFQVKYYTFSSTYQESHDEYSIVSLPLSKKEKGRFIPAAFDDIRNMAKKSSGKLVRYSSDDSVSWRENLAQYGIIQNEWRTIEDINANEDGLSKYFADFKTSDDLINGMIIPRIEEKQSHSVSKDDSSLETMLIAHAKNYCKRQGIIKEREICNGFLEGLGEVKTKAEELWQNNDALSGCISELFAFSDALENAITQQKEKSRELKENSDKLKGEQKHIGWEKASAEYYTCKDKLESKTDALKTAQDAKDKARDLLDKAKKELTLTECAYYYGQLVEIAYKIEGISAEIERRENDSEAGHKLAVLKYSAFKAISEELERILPEVKRLKEESDKIKTDIEDCRKELSSVSKGADNAKTDADKAEAIYDKQKENDDKIISELDIDAMRWFDGRYHAEELDKWEKTQVSEMNKLKAGIEKSENKISKYNDRLNEIPEEIDHKNREILSKESELRELERKILDYKSLEEKIRNICAEYSFDFDLRFTSEIRKYLSDKLVQTQAEIDNKVRELEAAEEAISAAERGTLHIPKLITGYLDSTGISYTTFESYILAQKDKGLLSGEAVQKLLSTYPFAAYAVIADEADIDTLKAEAADKWLPAALPVLTPGEVELMLQGVYNGSRTIAAYAKDYFSDKEAYADGLRSDLLKDKESLQLLKDRTEKYNADIKIAESFAEFDKDWLSIKNKNQEKLESDIKAVRAAVQKSEKERADIKVQLRNLQDSVKQQQDAKEAVHDKLKSFNKLSEQLQEEERLYDSFAEARKKLKELKKNESELKVRFDNLSAELAGKEEKLKEEKALCVSLNEGLSQVKGACRTDEETAGEWNSLLTQYKAMRDAQGTELNPLIKERDDLLKQKEDKESEIAKRNCPQEEYIHIVHSKEQEDKLRDEVSAFEKSYREKENIYNEEKTQHAVANSRLEIACSNLGEFDGEPLPIAEVGSSFDKRSKDIEKQLIGMSHEIEACRAEQGKLERTQERVKINAERYTRPPKCGQITLLPDYEEQLSSLTKQINEWSETVKRGSVSVEGSLKNMKESYGTALTDIDIAISDMLRLLTEEAVRGDRYYTLNEHIEASMHTTRLRISQIDTDLDEFNKTKADIIRQCVIQGKQMYEGLMQLSNNSKVKIHDKRCRMLKFDIPDSVDENVARAAITSEIDKGTEELADRLSADEAYADSDIRKMASRIVGSKRLLRKYIGSENIILHAYKIDSNPNNCGYRTWKETQVNNSGAEKFVVYFAVILALMAYARDSSDDGIGSKNNRSVLILDNPFGPISSKHVLQPMFEISHRYNVQMVCLSDLDKSDIRSCFGIVIKAVVKQFALSSKEQLTHEGNEMIEHGYYKSEQLQLF